MRYTIRRINIWSAIRMSLALGWLVALCPALGLAWVLVRALQAASRALGQVQNIEVGAFGQVLAQVNLLNTLGLEPAAQTTSQLSQNLTLTFVGFALILVVAGAVVAVLVAVLFSVGYNALAAVGGGLEVELRPRSERIERAERPIEDLRH